MYLPSRPLALWEGCWGPASLPFLLHSLVQPVLWLSLFLTPLLRYTFHSPSQCVCVRLFTCTHVCAAMSVCLHECVYPFLCTHTCVLLCTYISMNVCVRSCVHIRVCSYVCVFASLCMCVSHRGGLRTVCLPPRGQILWSACRRVRSKKQCHGNPAEERAVMLSSWKRLVCGSKKEEQPPCKAMGWEPSDL